MAFSRVAALRIAAQGGLARHHGLDREPGFGDLDGFLVGDGAHAGAAVRLADDEAFLIEHGQRHADIGAVDAEPLGEFDLDQPLVRRQPAARDRIAQARGDVDLGGFGGGGHEVNPVNIIVNNLRA